jgi:hypothetical protein
MKALNGDLNMPCAMASVQETSKSDLDLREKLVTVLDFDRVLGLDLEKVTVSELLPVEIPQKVEARKKARAE